MDRNGVNDDKWTSGEQDLASQSFSFPSVQEPSQDGMSHSSTLKNNFEQIQTTPFPTSNRLSVSSSSSLARSQTTSATQPPGPRTHRHTSSVSSIPYHPPVSPENYVRTQPLGSRGPKPFDDVSHSPTISGGLTRQLSVASASGSEGEGARRRDDDEGGPESPVRNRRKSWSDIRRLRGRSESMPILEPKEVEELRKEANAKELAALPPNVKLWLPSHLALYLAAHLDLHPLVATEITDFIRSSRLSGRTFLRLRDEEMTEIGINVRWRGALSAARDKLKSETWANRIVGFGSVGSVAEGGDGQSPISPRLEVEEGASEEEEAGKEEWKLSWRTMSGNKSRGRVKGMAFALEAVEDNSPANSPEQRRIRAGNVHSRAKVTNPRVFDQFVDPARPQLRKRADSELSTTSTASIDSGKGSQQSEEAPSSWLMTSPEMSRAEIQVEPGELSAEVYRAKQASIGSASGSGSGSRTPVHGRAGRAQKPKLKTQSTVTRGPGAKLVTRKLERWNAVDGLPEDGEHDETVTRRTAGRSASGKSQLADLFDLDLAEGRTRQSTVMSERDVVSSPDVMRIEVGDGKGSMVLVKRSQLEALEQRMAEIESQLEALSQPASPRGSGAASPRQISDWLRSSFGSLVQDSNAGSIHGDAVSGLPSPKAPAWIEPPTWGQLGWWMGAASVGIGLVAGEVVVARLTGWRRR